MTERFSLSEPLSGICSSIASAATCIVTGTVLRRDPGVRWRHCYGDAGVRDRELPGWWSLMPIWLNDDEFRTLTAACERLIPSDETAGAVDAGAPDYIDRMLGAFLVDPPLIWAGGPSSGRFGGADGFATFHRLTALDELAWRMRIEGSLGIPEREFNGPGGRVAADLP